LVQNPYLKFSVEALLHEANPKGEPYFKKTHFIKSLFLLQENLKEKLDIELPYCWYLHGPYIEERSFEAKTGTQFEKYLNPDGSTIRIHNIYSEGVSEADKKLIFTEIKKILSKYRVGNRWEQNYIDDLVGDAYRKSPFKYQQIFKREYLPSFSEFLENPKIYEIGYEKISTRLLKDLDKLVLKFPKSDMYEIFDEYLMWDDINRLKIENHEPITNVHTFSNENWEFFCHLLRIKKNEFVLPQVVEKWEHEFSKLQPRYNQSLENAQEYSLLWADKWQNKASDIDCDIIVTKLMAYARDSYNQS
jgi:hypothetical protein